MSMFTWRQLLPVAKDFAFLAWKCKLLDIKSMDQAITVVLFVMLRWPFPHSTRRRKYKIRDLLCRFDKGRYDAERAVKGSRLQFYLHSWIVWKYKTSLPACPKTAAPARLFTISLCLTRLSLFTCKLENKISYVNGKPFSKYNLPLKVLLACASHEFVLAET